MRSTQSLPIAIILAAVVFAAWWVFDYQPDTAPPPPLGTSERVGYIVSIEDRSEGFFIEFDEVSLLLGAVAVEAALQSGQCTEETLEDCAPNDFFIDDNSPLITSLPLATEPIIKLVTIGSSTLTEVPFTDWQNRISQGAFVLNNQLFRITITDAGSVIALEEIYLP